jgi:2-polyprenyl-6-methoxyphenol hydroxylase-like FAD-dependent oxidoreductase
MRIAIAGFGVGGAALAVALARDDHDVTFMELVLAGRG